MRVTIVGDTAATGNSRFPILTMKLQNQDFFLLVPATFVPTTFFFQYVTIQTIHLEEAKLSVEFNSAMVEFRSVILTRQRRNENSARPWRLRTKKRAVTETSVGRLVNKPAAVRGAEMPARPPSRW